MSRKKIISLLAAALLVISGLGGLYFYNTHIFLDGHVFSRNAALIDLRGKEISAEIYENLRGSLPDCEIIWDVPFQGSRFPEDTRELSVTSFTEEDAAMLKYFPQLETVNGGNCTDYRQLTALKQTYPALDVRYQIHVDGRSYPQDTREISVSNISDEEIALLRYLPELQVIHAEECGDLSQIMKLRQQYPDCNIHWVVPIGDISYAWNTAELHLKDIQITEIAQQLAYLPQLRLISLTDPVGDAESLLALTQTYPEVDFFWQMDVLGVPVTSEDMEADLTGILLDSLDPIESAFAYFPRIKKVILSDCGIDNETMAAFREKMRPEYKVVWSVDVGYLTVRTDDTWFMPGKFEMGLTDKQSYNLRYCEDMVCIDVGHKPITHCEWVAFMPNLKYLIIADTCVTDLTPLTGLKNLIYLEMFISQVKDYSPLLTCTALEDLNLCYSHGDPEPIKRMTWLKRLWWAESPIPVEEFQTYLPNTQLMFLHHSSTGNGWREGQNYYDMREFMGVPIMYG